MIDLATLTIERAHQALSKKEYSVRTLVDAYLSVIKEKNPRINAYLEIFDDIDVQVEKAQARFDAGTATLLTGIPLAIKDNILIEGKEVTASSKILSGYHATYDATVIKALKEANAIFLGRTNMDEFAMGSSTETSAYGITRNPIDETRVPGGSSGGSAASVAMHGALAAFGSETCGSIRQPSAFCGLVGLKPTYGALSRYGLIAMGNSLDQIGPMAKTVGDVEALYNATTAYDPKDSTSVPMEKRAKKNGEPRRIGVPVECFQGEGFDPEVLANFKQTIDALRGAGYEIVELTLPLLSYSLPIYYIIMPAEASTNLARFDGMRYGFRDKGAKDLFDMYAKSRGQGFGREVRRRILLGTYILSHGYYDAYYAKAVALRERVTKEINTTFESVDIIATPTAPTPPFKLGEKISDPVAMYYSDIFSAPANLSGAPAIALPTGTTREGLPLSIQFTAPHWQEENLFLLGKKLETLRKSQAN
jgi:aspartyl-tRNA(Asn)/glutamyl-tRNA(Gln) amidotransferase subunit A